MNVRQYTIAISSIGSGIGQAIVTGLRSSSRIYRTIGFGNGAYEYGALECDHHENVPSIFHPEYVDVLLEKCLRYEVDILIPGLDNDVMILAENAASFTDRGIDILTASNKLVSLCRNKELISQELRSISDHFVESFNKTDALLANPGGKLSFPCIAKSRGGSGSVGVKIIRNLEEMKILPEDYIFQDLLLPDGDDYYYEEFHRVLENNQNPQLSELSIQFVTGKDGEFLGKIATINNLKFGVPIEIFPIDQQEIWDVVDLYTPRLVDLGLRGPINIQGRITDHGIRFFEINPRFTGLSGLRAIMGFNEVEECVKNWLGIPSQKLPFQGNTSKFGIRQVAGKAIAIQDHEQAKSYHAHLHKTEGNTDKVLLITGSSGYLGQNLVDALDREKYKIWVLTTDKKNCKRLLKDRVDEYFSKNDFYAGNIPLGRVDILLHAGFARPYRTDQEIASSLSYTEELFNIAGLNEVPAIINISSQSVYGQGSASPWREDSLIAPESPYATAKYASELTLKSIKRLYPHLMITSLRLAGLAGGVEGLISIDLVSKFVIKALLGETIEIQGQHIFERLDVRDAVDGIIALLNLPALRWKDVYNLGRGQTFNIEELADEVINQVSQIGGFEPPPVIKNIKDTSLRFGMDSNIFYEDTGWQPKYSLSETIQSLITYYDKYGLEQ